MRIELHEVSKAFGAHAVLQRVNWTIESGDSWRLTGASGIGKTTLLRILMGLETADSGVIRGLNDVSISAVFQEHRLCPWMTAAENICLTTPACTAQQAEQALCRLLPEQALRQPCDTLSGGMQRRVALVRALLAPSDLLLLDEPFSGMDEDNIRRSLQLIAECRGTRAVVLVSHEQRHLTVQDKILSLSADNCYTGRVV